MACLVCKQERATVRGYCRRCVHQDEQAIAAALDWRNLIELYKERHGLGGLWSREEWDHFDQQAEALAEDLATRRRDPFPTTAKRLTFDQPTPRAQGQFLAREIMADVMAPEREIAEAIEHAILLFAETQAAPLQRALRLFGRHAVSCRVWDGQTQDPTRCDCGFQAALDALVDRVPFTFTRDVGQLPAWIDVHLDAIFTWAQAARDHALQSPAPRARLSEAVIILRAAQQLRYALVANLSASRAGRG